MKSGFALKYLFVFLIGIFLLSSCTMQKRKYRKGFFIDKPSSSHQVSKPIKTLSRELVVSKKTSTQPKDLVCELKNDFKPYNKSLLTNKQLGLGKKVNQKCDTLFLKNGSVKIVSIVKIKESIVYFNNCGSVSNDDYFIPVNELSEIHYSDGKIIGRQEKANSDNSNVNEPTTYENTLSDDEKLESIKMLNNASLFFLILVLLLSIIMIFGLPGLYLLILPFSIIGIICSFISRRRAIDLTDGVLIYRSNILFLLSWLMLLVSTIIFVSVAMYLFSQMTFAPSFNLSI